MPSAADGTHPRLEVFVLPGIGEIRAGDDLAAIILTAAGASLADGDIIAVTSKIVSKAEGRQVAAADREQAITDETVRIVATRAHPGGVTRIVENRQGLVMAAAGVDASNVVDGTVLLLPTDPDASARALCQALRAATGLNLGVLITDTVGRPWRDGQTDIAIGAAGVAVLDDLRGSMDANGRRLDVTVAAVADEIAGAADLIKGKTSGNPVAVLRGMGQLVGPIDPADRGARRLLRDSANDMFRVGSAEAYAEGYAAGLAAAEAAASVAHADQSAVRAPASGDAVGTASPAEDVLAPADVTEHAPSAPVEGDTVATRENPAVDVPESAPSAPSKGRSAATREVPPVHLRQIPLSALPRGQDAATREIPAAELPVGAASEGVSGREVSTHVGTTGDLPVGAPSEGVSGREVSSQAGTAGDLPVGAASEGASRREVATRGTAPA